jgi:hypothetical protein
MRDVPGAIHSTASDERPTNERETPVALMLAPNERPCA